MLVIALHRHTMYVRMSIIIHTTPVYISQPLVRPWPVLHLLSYKTGATWGVWLRWYEPLVSQGGFVKEEEGAGAASSKEWRKRSGQLHQKRRGRGQGVASGLHLKGQRKRSRRHTRSSGKGSQRVKRRRRPDVTTWLQCEQTASDLKHMTERAVHRLQSLDINALLLVFCEMRLQNG